MQIVIFTLADKYYGLNTENVLEISKVISPTPVPNSPDWLEGLVNLRGDIVTMVNLSKILQFTDTLCYNKFIILQDNDEKIGLLVTEVMEVTTIKDQDFKRLDNTENDTVKGIVKLDDKVINIIDSRSLLKNEG